MSISEPGVGWPDPVDPDTDPDLTQADVLDFTAAHARRAGQPRPVVDPDTDDLPRGDGDGFDAESYDDTPPAEGGTVDPPDLPEAPYRTRVERRPVLADWARSWRDLRAAARHTAGNAGYTLAYH